MITKFATVYPGHIDLPDMGQQATPANERRYSNEILATVPGLSDRLLTERLRELESEGVVRRTVIAGPPVRVSYDLTEAGRALEPVIETLSHWAERWVTL